MIGITSFGTYVPRLRLDRKAAYEALNRPSPDTAGLAKGTRSVCNADEDALTMAVAAARHCLDEADRDEVDTAYLCGTTLPFADRQNASIQKTALGLPDRLHTADLGGSLRAGTSALLAAFSRLKSVDSRNVLVTATDNRIGAPGSPDELLQGDAAAALLLGTKNLLAEYLGGVSIARDFPDRVRTQNKTVDYRWEDRWSVEEGWIPLLKEGLAALAETIDLDIAGIDRFAIPTPSGAARRRIIQGLKLPEDRVANPLLDTVGDTGAAHPLLLLACTLETADPGETVLVAGVGGGCDILCFRIPETADRKKRDRGVARQLRRTTPLSHYAQFLTLRGVLTPDTGIRGDIQTKTAMSVLYREQEMLLGLKGGLCEACGTPQFPKSRICVNPKCRKPDTQAPYSFADRTARVRTYTGDYLLPSPTPPSLYGLIEFDDGGRMTAELTDCALENLAVGIPVRMVFRRRYEDTERGFVGYFWKAVPMDKDYREVSQ